MDHDYSIACWDLSVIPAVRDDVLDRITGVHRDTINLAVTKLHEPPFPKKIKET